MIWRERNFLLLLVLSGVVLSQNEDRKVRNFFSRARSGAQLPVGGEQFQGNVLRIGRRQNLRQADVISEQEIVALETSSAAELAREDLSRAQVAPAPDARVRPEVELEHSIQGQVAEALIRDSLTGRALTGPPTRPEGHSPDGIRSRLIQRPVQRPIAPPEPKDSTTENSDIISDNEREEIARFRASRPSRIRPLVRAQEPASRQEESERIEASQVPIQPRRIVQPPTRGSPQQPPQSRRANLRRPESPALRAPASIRPAVQLEVDAMMKKHSAALRLQAGSDKMEEINRNLLVAKLNTHMAEKEAALEKAEAQAAASSENSRLAAEIEELRARLLKAEEALVGRSPAPVDANNNLADRAREISQFRSRQPSRPRSFDGQPRQPEEARQPEVRPKDNTPVYQPGSFFGRNSQIPTVPLRQQLPALPRQQIQMVKVQDIQVPKFSKMVKNVGLRLLPSDERSIPVEEIATPSRSNPRTSDVRQRQQQLAPRRNIQQTPEPAVQGFKVVGDPSNRVIFLNVAELGLTLGPGRTLKLGNSELIPVDSSSAEPRGPPQFGDRFMNVDAVDKMVTTHLQHNAPDHLPVNLPAFRNPLDDVRTLPQQVRGRLQPAGNRFESAREAQTQPQARKQPVFFSNRFDDQKPVATEEPSRQAPRQGKALQESARSPLDRSVQFGSFPQRSGPPQQDARSQQLSLQQLPRFQQLPVQQDLTRAQQIPVLPDQLSRFQIPQQTSRFQQIAQQQDPLARFQIPQQQSQQLETVPLSRQFSRFQQSQIQRQQPQLQQARFQETPRFETVRERLEAQIPRYEPPLQNNLPTPDVPGIEAHLAEQNKIINLQRTQAEKAATLERRRLGLEQPPQQISQPQQNLQQQPQQNFQQLQQSYQQQAIQNQQPQQQNLIPQVPGLQEHQAALQQHLATIQQFNAQRPEHQSQPQQPVPQFQPQPTPQFQPQPQPTQFQQPPSQQQIPGLEQHARFVSELQAAQQALGTR